MLNADKLKRGIMAEVVAGNAGQTRGDRVREASKERRSLQKQELRSSILAAAAELFLEYGYEHFSLRQVAERIGYSATTIYLHFKNKDDLLFEVVTDGWQRFSDELLAAAAATDDPLERLHAMGRVYVSFGLTNPAAYNLMFVQRTDFLMHENLHSEGKPVDLFVVLCEAVQAAMDAGIFPPGDVVGYSDAIWASAHGVVTLCPSMFDDERRQRAVEIVLQATLDGLRAR
jgi:AcrR family transcriptional regulator